MSAYKAGNVRTCSAEALVNACFDAGHINDCGLSELLKSASGDLHRHVRGHGNNNQIGLWRARCEGNTSAVVGGESYRRRRRVGESHDNIVLAQGETNTGTEQARTNDVNAPEGCVSHRGHASAPRWKMGPDAPGSTHWTPPAY